MKSFWDMDYEDRLKLPMRELLKNTDSEQACRIIEDRVEYLMSKKDLTVAQEYDLLLFNTWVSLETFKDMFRKRG